MFDLTALKSISLKDENQRTPLLCVTETTVSFGIGALEALSKPAHARLLLNEEKGELCLVGCDATDTDAFEFVKQPSDRYVRLKSRALHRLCNELTGLSPVKYPYRVDGRVETAVNETKVVVFNMRKARITNGKRKNKEDQNE